MLRAYLFDMDGVLCHLSDERRIGHLAAKSRLTADEIWHAIWGSGFEDRSDAGAYGADEYLLEFGARLGMPFGHEEWCAYRKAGMDPYHEVLETARMLSKHSTVAVLTNNGKQMKRGFTDIFPELHDIFGDHLYVSGELHMAKPNPAIYRHVCELIGVAPEQTMMIDDRLENIHGAERAGLHGHHFTSAEDLRKALLSMLPKPPHTA